MKKWIIGAIAVLLLAVLVFAVYSARSRPYYLNQFHVLVLAVHPGTNGTVRLDVLLTNGTSVSLNVVDDAAGNPAFLIDPGSNWSGGLRPPMSFSKTLTSGASLTDSVILTNPPARFRLAYTLRNLESERKIARICRFLPNSLAVRYADSRREDWLLPLQYCDWVDFPALTNNLRAEH